MKIVERYILYLQQIGEGTRQTPEGLTLTKDEPLARAAELQEQIMEMGIPAFVRLCARADGEELSQEELDSFRPEDLMEALQAQLQGEAPQVEPQEAPEGEEDQGPPQIDEPDGPRSVYEVLIDCCSLDEKLMYYLIDTLKRGAEEEFQKLALVTTRKAFTQYDFLYWYGTKAERGTEEELICSTLMDACFDRLAKEGQVELIAALLSGDQTTFELFRCEAPELVHLQEATFDWYERNYLQGLYPLRYMLKFNGIQFPKEEAL
ncbi:MAG: hypothetical protein IKT58_00630 [Oscillospiraceae bacterium]|nr:hypothetical protein [Oscillospiraceae bacterium]